MLHVTSIIIHTFRNIVISYIFGYLPSTAVVAATKHSVKYNIFSFQNKLKLKK